MLSSRDFSGYTKSIAIPAWTCSRHDSALGSNLIVSVVKLEPYSICRGR